MKQGTGAAAAVFGGVLAVTGGLGWVLYEAGRPDEPPPAPTPKVPQTGPGRRGSGQDEPAPDEDVPPHLRVKKVPKSGAPRIPIEGHDDLNARDWKEAALAYEEKHAVSREMLEKGVPRPDDAADQQRMELMQRRIHHFMSAVLERPQGLAPGQPYTPAEHPASAVNLVASVLERADLPLTESQTARLADLATRWGPRYEAVEADVKRDDPAGWTLNVLLAKATLLDSFYAELFAVLTPAQHEAVTPADFRGRMRLDFVSSTAAWGRMARPLIFTDDKALVDSVTNGLAGQLGVPARADEVRPFVETWVQQGGFDAADLLDLRGFTRTAHVAPAVPRMIDLVSRVLDALKLPEEVAAAARRHPLAFVPLRK